jgi:hypothetical protein
MTDEDFLTRIRRLQGQQKAAKYQAARAKSKKENRAAHAKAGSGMVMSVRVDPARITLVKLRFMGEVPDHLHLLEEKEEPTCQETQWAT